MAPEQNETKDYRKEFERNATPRKPTQAEKEAIIASESNAVLMGGQADDDSNVENSVNDAYIAVFDHYQTGCPGYAGKLAVVAYDGSPDYVMSFTFDDEGHATRLVSEIIE